MEHGEVILDLELMDRIDLHDPTARVRSGSCRPLSLQYLFPNAVRKGAEDGTWGPWRSAYGSGGEHGTWGPYKKPIREPNEARLDPFWELHTFLRGGKARRAVNEFWRPRCGMSANDRKRNVRPKLHSGARACRRGSLEIIISP